jgi:hypothetical protein
LYEFDHLYGYQSIRLEFVRESGLDSPHPFFGVAWKNHPIAPIPVPLECEPYCRFNATCEPSAKPVGSVLHRYCIGIGIRIRTSLFHTGLALQRRWKHLDFTAIFSKIATKRIVATLDRHWQYLSQILTKNSISR